jgi:signal transduction histidine kinase
LLDDAPAPRVEDARDDAARRPQISRGIDAAPFAERAWRGECSSSSPPHSLIDEAPDERLLAWLRLVATGILLLSIAFDPEPHGRLEHTLVLVYLCYSTALLVACLRTEDHLRRYAPAVHGIDFAWTAILSAISGGISSHGFSFFAFVLAASAYRWGLKRTLINAALILAVGIAQIAAIEADRLRQFDLQVVHVSALVVAMAALFGAIADRLHTARRHAVAVARLVADLSRAPRLSGAIVNTIVTLTRLMRARESLLVVEEAYAGTLSLWRVETAADGRCTASRTDLPPGTARDWFASGADRLGACELHRDHRDARPVVTIELEPRDTDGESWLPLPQGVSATMAWSTLLAVPFSASDAWRGQLYVADPAVHPGGTTRLRGLDDLVKHAVPGLLNLYLLRRLRARAETLERARISRELHDTVHQSLAGIDMRMDVLRRRAQADAPALADEFTEVQLLLRHQAMDLRQVIERMRSTDVDARRLPAALADLVDRFARTTEIDARLNWAIDRLDIPPQHCSEIIRIVQEALFNVRRHSGATRVLVRVEAEADRWSLIVEDNGRGMGFTARLTDEELEAQRKGPRVIRERAVALGGTLAIESSSRGTRLELEFPLMEGV